MEIASLESDRDAARARAAGELRGGRLVVVPTDTVYGLAADAFNAFATAMVFQAKGRARTLPLPVLVGRPRQAWALCAHVPDAATDLAAAFWPGPLTLVLPEAEGMPWDLGESRGSVALRMPLQEDLLWLLETVGPLAVTSANVTGRPTPREVSGIAEELGHAVSLYLDAGPAPGEVPSTVVDLTGAPRITREGALPAADVEHVLRLRA